MTKPAPPASPRRLRSSRTVSTPAPQRRVPASRSAQNEPPPNVIVIDLTDTTPTTARKRKRENDAPTEETPRVSKKVKAEARDCSICAETKPVNRDFPKNTVCDHDNCVCKRCYERQFRTKFEENRTAGWSACTCPLCNTAVGEDGVKNLMTRASFRELARSIKQAQKHSAHNWVWCPNTTCNHGQLHRTTRKPFVSCDKCKTKICFTHQVVWHEGLTCHEFDEAGDRDETNKKDLAEIKRTTKPCPYCKMRIRKEGGCNHMTCRVCQKHWMWDTVPFDGETQATSAEVAGGAGGAPVLQGEERQLVEEVIQFENNERSRQDAATTVGRRLLGALDALIASIPRRARLLQALDDQVLEVETQRRAVPGERVVIDLTDD